MRFTLCLLATAFLWTGCKKEETTTTTEQPGTAAPAAPATAPAAAPTSTAAAAPSAEAMDKLTAKLEARSGSTVSGEVELTSEGDGVRVKATFKSNKGKVHAAHIHQNADCSAPDAKSAGDHFNPGNHPHGIPPAEQRHLGDLGNITVNDDNNATIDVVVKGANLKSGDPNSFVGRSLIVHEKPDDGGQPAGNAGARVACAELKAS